MFRTICNTRVLPLAALAAGLCLSVSAQEANPTSVAPGARSADVIAQGQDGTYIYHVNVVQRDLDAVNYLNRSGSTNVGFQGTNLMPQARGEAKVDSKTGKTDISVKFDRMTPANGFGPEYLTYVLWAISADGKPQNLGELELAGDNASLTVTSGFQSFGMIVTAEPYYSVSQPSDVIVLQNVFRKDTQGILQTVNVHYALLPKGLYANTEGSKAVMHPITDREHTPLALYEAYNAQRIALNTGADKYSSDIMSEVAQDIQDSKHRDVKLEFTYARQAVQRAEDARITTLRKQSAERQQQERDARASAEQQALASQQQAAASQQAAAASQADAARAQAEADRAAAARAQAEAQKAQADAAAAAAQAQAADSQRQAQEAQNSVAALRSKLLAQLNAVLQTTETPRGLMVNLNDVLFDTGKYTLKQNTQISLAQVATILNLYQNLKVQVEGYTDNTGTDQLNQKLSENRARAVSDFLTGHGVPPGNVTSNGYGKNDPVADNSNAAGRAQNRRVELIVSGDAIGVQTTSGPTGAQ